MTVDGLRTRGNGKKTATLVGIAVSLILVVLVALLASGDRSRRLDASSEDRLKTSIEAMTSRMSEEEKKAFLADCMAVALPDAMQWAFRNAFLVDNSPTMKGTRLFKPLHGMSAVEIHRKAKDARRASTKAKPDAADATSAQPLPGVPSPFNEP